MFNNEYKSILKDLSLKVGIKQEELDNIYKTYWKFVRYIIRNTDFSDSNLDRRSINIKGLGKFHCSNKRLENLKNNRKFIKDGRIEHKEDKTYLQ